MKQCLQTKIAVLGLGDSIKRFKRGIASIGVNDIYKYHKVNYLVCVDKPEGFKPERLEVIRNSTPVLFFSHLIDWSFMESYHKIELSKHRGYIDDIETHYPYSNNSTYCALAIAYKLGFKDIEMYGVDFTNHAHINGGILDNSIKHFIELNKFFMKKGVSLRVTRESIISNYIKSL